MTETVGGEGLDVEPGEGSSEVSGNGLDFETGGERSEVESDEYGYEVEQDGAAADVEGSGVNPRLLTLKRKFGAFVRSR